MKLVLEMDLDNSAFEPHRNIEAARILRTVSRKLEVARPVELGDLFALKDFNGNTVGRLAAISDDKDLS